MNQESTRLSSLGVAATMAIAIAGALGSGGCAMRANPTALAHIAAAPTPATLYERLGGQPAIDAVSAKLIDQAASDPRTKRGFEGSDLPNVKASVASMLCQATGGPCVYKGESMREVHKGMGVTGEQFAAMAGMADSAMASLGVAPKERSEVMAILASTKADIVERP